MPAGLSVAMESGMLLLRYSLFRHNRLMRGPLCGVGKTGMSGILSG